MTPERWKQIDDLFNDALDRPAEERADFLDSACEGDADLRAEVDSLLASAAAPAARLREAIGREASLVTEGERRPWEGRRIGPYRLLRELGEGGMGAVYLAARDDAEYTSEVAIKVLHRGRDTAQAAARFRDERQILAALSHPYIVKLLDGGTTDDGLPYLVMEHVDGLPITRWAEERRLSVRERLSLFRKVCAAVELAHQKLIIHRDLKPSNILVAGDGSPKLLDFGIAKLLDPEAGREAYTRTGVRLLTPEYASPEQVLGEPVSTATDVYSLGAVLYELLTGAPAQKLDGDGLSALRTMIERDPARPSVVAPPPLRRALAGDIDAIVLKALRKEPSSRYPSVEQLSLDIGRHLDGLPVQARSGTFTYRTGKLIRRSRSLLATLALVFFTLSAATIVSVRQARRAERRFHDVRRLANTMLFDIDGKIQSLEGATEARELIVSRALEYIDGLAGEASDDAALSRELAVAYMKTGDIQGNPRNSNMGRPKDALASYTKALALLEGIAASGRADEATLREIARARVGSGKLYSLLHELEPARRSLTAALDLINTMPEGRTFDYSLAELAHLSFYEIEAEAEGGDTSAAGKHAEAMADVAARWSRAAPESMEARYWIGVANEVRGNHFSVVGDADAAMRAFGQAAAAFSLLSAENPENATYRREVAYAHIMGVFSASGIGEATSWFPAMGDMSAAEREAEEARLIIERAVARDSGDARAREELVYVLTLKARLTALRDPGAAMALFQQVSAAIAGAAASARSGARLRLLERASLCSQAEPLAKLGRREEALATVERGLAIAVDDVDDEHRWSRSWCLVEGARARRALGELAAARAALEEAISRLRAEIAEHPSKLPPYVGVVESLELLADIEGEQRCDRVGEASALWRSWPGAPTGYTRRRQVAIDARLVGCPPK